MYVRMGACACGAYAYLEVVFQHVKEHLQILRCCRFASANLDTIIIGKKLINQN